MDARDIIGKNDSQDWQLAPEAHAADLPPEAGALARILQRPSIHTLMSAFQEADALAVSAQKRYRFWGRLGIYAIAAAALIGTALIVQVDGFFGPSAKWIVLTMQYIALVISVIAAQWLQIARPFEEWMANRGKAEIARIQIFDEVLSADEELHGPQEKSVLPLQFEYFRRYQLDVQRAYYKGRGEQHRRASGSAGFWKWLSISLTILWLLICTVALAHFAADQGWTDLPSWLAFIDLGRFEPWIIALGVVASSVYAANSARSLMDLDARNAARYKTVSDNLEYVTVELMELSRTAANQGDRDTVLAFVRRVQDLLASEHKEWVALREVAPNASALLAQSGAVALNLNERRLRTSADQASV